MKDDPFITLLEQATDQDCEGILNDWLAWQLIQSAQDKTPNKLKVKRKDYLSMGRVEMVERYDPVGTINVKCE